MDKQLYAGNMKLEFSLKTVSGNFVSINNEPFYKITNFDHMRPFFMSIVSDSDHWLYIWSNGALTAGRKNAGHALFPYYTDDKIKDSAEITGSKTILRIEHNGHWYLWEPFSDRYAGAYPIERNLYKNIYGNKLIFEEINKDLMLTFRYAWMTSDLFGFIKKSVITNSGEKPVMVEVLDGIQNILPAAVQPDFQNTFSTLVDAYKKNELEADCGLGLYSLSSIPVDRAEPSESLRATTVWSAGVNAERILLSSGQLDDYRRGLTVGTENDIRAARGAYFIQTELQLGPGKDAEWFVIAEVDQDSAQVVSLKERLKQNKNLIAQIEADIACGTEKLQLIIAKADGLQKSADLLTSSRHFSNVLFNVMRGGIFEDGYRIDISDFLKYLARVDKRNVDLYKKILNSADGYIGHSALLRLAEKSRNANFERLCFEYLPLSFSRRHGDPSRPWNKFSIDVRDDQGNKNLNYQGNWRDIFQNWEALALSFPEYLESMITRFVNASTADGYNPYRLTREGVDWEEMDPHDPWAYIGYWGDHQIIYLTKLLELSGNFHPGKLEKLLGKEMFTYANVPYKIKSYDAIISDPHNTVDYDHEQDRMIKQNVQLEGERAKYIQNGKGELYLVSLVEKLLVPVLAKLSNFIPEAGIWLNTQRPEWNDANNALVGYGVSMVTLYYMRRHVHFLNKLIRSGGEQDFNISAEVVRWLNESAMILEKFKGNLSGCFSDTDRRAMTDALGSAGSDYRLNLYAGGFSGESQSIKTGELIDFFTLLLKFIDHSIHANRREDHLYHAYNLISIGDNSIRIRHLYEMLEGQVAVLSSGQISAGEALKLLDALHNSKLYREDQSTYLLYPDRQLPRFTEKNHILQADFERSELLQELIRQGNPDIVVRDATGGLHFNGDFRNAAVLKDRLNNLDKQYQSLVEKEIGLIAEIYEKMFDHQSFTGRSGTFFKYEGLGSTYWHMVSKLVLSVQECYFRAIDAGTDSGIIEQLKRHYYEIKEGIGVHKSPDLYGGFPTDPYSHTPARAGVQQPGMTGQVKEDILSRFGELGIFIEDGCLGFRNDLLNMSEFSLYESSLWYFDTEGKKCELTIPSHSLCLTIAQVPVILTRGDRNQIILKTKNDETIAINSLKLTSELTNNIFSRDGIIQRMDVTLLFRE